MSWPPGLPASQRPGFRAACDRAAELLNAALRDQADTARAHGPRAVAEAAHRGGRSVDEVEAAYLRLVRENQDDAAARAA